MFWGMFIAVLVVAMLACRPVRKALLWLIIVSVLGWETTLAFLGIGFAVGCAWLLLEARADSLAG